MKVVKNNLRVVIGSAGVGDAFDCKSAMPTSQDNAVPRGLEAVGLNRDKQKTRLPTATGSNLSDEDAMSCALLSG